MNILDSAHLNEVMDDDTEFIPLMTNEDEEQMNQEELPGDLPILPIKNTVLFPGVVIPITVGRDKSIRLVKEAQAGSKMIGVVAQRDKHIEEPGPADLYEIGTVAQIMRVLRMPDGNTTVIIQGKKRFKIIEYTELEPYHRAKVEAFRDSEYKRDDEFDAIVSTITDLALRIIEVSPNIPSEAQFAIKNIESSTFLINFISSNMNLDVEGKQGLLEESDFKERSSKVLKYLTEELQMLEMKNEIQSRVKSDIDKQQREYFLYQQMKTIQEELGEKSYDVEIDEMREKAKSKKWSAEVGELFEKELSKLKRMNPQAPDFTVQRNYLELLLDLPWGEYTDDNFDLVHAEKVLNRDHFGLEKVKERIIEHLAVLKIKGDMKAPILCLYGPPGVGKTSLGKSIAEALNREYVRMSLGGLRDEAEIRGHRKTYIGAMPGRIIQNIRKAKSSNPVFVLDEIDKLSQDLHGDPSSAMLEVLDPEQNNSFYDNYLEVGYDLSRTFFIATANNLGSIHPALRDRMEIIDISGYTVEEKVEIARKHLLPKQIKNHGLKTADLKIPKGLYEPIIEQYTRESGVRGLDKVIAKLVRHAAVHIAKEESYDPKLTKDAVTEILGAPKVLKERYLNNSVAGVVTGLAWTAVGGDILFIESSLSRGKGGLNITGNLGNVMKESARIAMEFLKSNADLLDLDFRVFDHWNVHIHVPEGAVPKDGPSAGITMLTALASLFTQRKVRSKLAMTGEITLRGRVLPVGGIKEKILAAKRASITDIILCEENRKDIDEINERYLAGLKFHFVTEMREVLDLALMKQKVLSPKKLNVWSEPINGNK